MAQLFGTSGVRGFTNTEMTPRLVMELAQSYGTLLGAGAKVATGRDTRHGAQMLESAATAGLNAAGVHAEGCGVVPMAALASYIVNERLAGGVLVTGSHMPPDRIGLILINSEGAYAPYAVSDEVERIHSQEKWARAPFDRIGTSAPASKPLERYVGRAGKMVNRRIISLNRFKVLVDAGNGTAGSVLPRLLRDLCCDVECVNCEQKPVPDRDCEPRAGTLQRTAQRARELGSDLACATDLDADRVVFLDEKAGAIPEDVAGCIFTKYVLSKRKGPVVVPINSSILIEKVCKDAGVPLHYCRVGQPATMEAMKKHGAVFSYEESGKYYFVKDEYWCDGILATMKLLEVMAQRNRKPSELAAEFPRLAQSKHKLPCPDADKPRIYPAVRKFIETHPFEEVDRLIDLDGLKTIYKSGSWLLVRVSGTEPLVRVFAESEKADTARELAEYGVELVKSILDK
jgi:phosphomannomutase/phosphoglucomutase